MFRSDAVESSVECSLEPLPSLHIPIDYLKEPLFFELQLEKEEGSMSVKSAGSTEMGVQNSRFYQYSVKNNYHANLLSTPNALRRFPATTGREKMCASEPVSAPHTSKKARPHDYLETRSFVLRREAMLRRERERMEELQRQYDITEDVPTPIVLDLDPQMLQPTKATRLRTEFIARRLKQREMADNSTYHRKGRDTYTTGKCSSTQNEGPVQAPVERLTRSAKLFKEHTSRRIRELELERIRKAQEEEGIIEKPVHIAHPSTCCGSQSRTAEKRPLENCFNRATRLLHQRIAERQEEIQKERDKEQAARDAILRPPRKTFDYKLRFQKGYDRNSPVRQHKCQHVQEKLNPELPRTSAQMPSDGPSYSSVELGVEFPVKRVGYRHYDQKEPTKSADISPRIEQERFSRTSCLFTVPQEPSTKPSCLSASNTERREVACQKDGTPDFPSSTCIVGKEAKWHHNAWKVNASDHHLTNRSSRGSGITMPNGDVNFNKALIDTSNAPDHALQSLDSSNRLMISNINGDTPNLQKHLKSDTDFFRKNAGFDLDPHALGLGEEVSSKDMCDSTREDTPSCVAYSKRQVETLGHQRKVTGPSPLEVSRSHSRFVHSIIDTISCKPSLKVASLSQRSSSGAQTRCSSLMALISPRSYAVCHSMCSDTLTRYRTLYFVVMQRLRRRFYMLWKQWIFELNPGGCPISSATKKWTLMEMSFPTSVPGKRQEQVSSGIVDETSHTCCDFTSNRSESLPRGAPGNQGPSAEGESPRIRVSISRPPALLEDGSATSKLAPNAGDEIALVSVEISLDSPYAVTLQGVAPTRSCLGQQGSLHSKRDLQTSFRTGETCTIDSGKLNVGEVPSEVPQEKDTASIDSMECASGCDTVREKASLRQMEDGPPPAFSVGKCVETQKCEKLSSCSDQELRDILALCSADVSLNLDSPPSLSRPSPHAPTPWCLSPALLSPSEAPQQHLSLGCVFSEFKMNQHMSSQQDSLQGGAIEGAGNVCDGVHDSSGQRSFLTEGEKVDTAQSVAFQPTEKDRASIEGGEYHSSMLNQSNIDNTMFSVSSIFPDPSV
ncbi:unnamed protein product [Phytomonas sp. EM1]|nr:unnamed protein product [Phytomonas sp. EM1]|eukprot:CCW65730.1 unnamed protein product [Phytomonas sp. isolate EM1]